ncbi:MAG: sulfatase-like hydrolase/transferase [Verrucomicrobia bacterium]|jgi:arylsulfatase A-like enzyme|nr:sulfatase-like hydrolase/transferase [Verrucomicrobiota bacterium]
MNVVFLHAHDAGKYAEPYGFPFDNPNLMAFAREGVLFRKAFAVSPTCGPSRAAMMTGQYPHQNGVVGLPGQQGWRIDDYGKHLARRLGEAGYETVLAGVQHEVEHADISPLGYERMLDTEAPAREKAGEFYPETIDKVEAFLATRKRLGDGRPFFLSIGIDEPHRDNIPRPELNLHGASDRFSKTRHYDPEKLDWRYTAPPPWLPDLPELRKDMESFREGVKLMDEYMGRVLYALEHAGLDDETLVVVTSDHGIEFPGGKKTLRDQGNQVMLILRGPSGGPIRGGKVVEPMVTHLDLYPTLCELLGLEAPHRLEGRSLLPLIEGRAASLHEATFSEQTYHGELEPLRAVRTERYKYVRRHLEDGPRMRHDGPATAAMEAAGWYGRETGREELFDLYLDPWEACNRIHDPALAKVRDALRTRLDEWMEATDDFFPSGAFPETPSGEL